MVGKTGSDFQLRYVVVTFLLSETDQITTSPGWATNRHLFTKRFGTQLIQGLKKTPAPRRRRCGSRGKSVLARGIGGGAYRCMKAKRFPNRNCLCFMYATFYPLRLLRVQAENSIHFLTLRALHNFSKYSSSFRTAHSRHSQLFLILP